MMTKLRYFLTALFLSFSAQAAIDALNFTSMQQEKDYHSLTQELRCPQCQNNNIADSNASIAVDMRAKVYELLQKGQNKQQIIDYMVERYGNFVTYNPPVTGSTIILWVAPLALMILGVVIVLRRKSGSSSKSAVEAQPNLTQEQQKRLEELLKERE
ncbi:cytochrome c-type biogenesis protein CcmH [Histophilus somni]|uniref:Cytochrome c-type biogenesis protein n=3 Tax=Histophilus somni TaxID=731 RepID=A0AAX2S004_HISSO|nr:cytochrome c-type biogenesis protein CcmH [Histophilus somni]QEH13050.1 cytochrome c-type biogenesis protein CcmH [Histophilus somni]QEH21046.1 cytochrome c-type biogenesis protein CcmH [Histophilus somni]QEH24638.1 cytochrome c-type biogenesis protein CcmH [Histophilus somni]QEH27535.1 cytochrome c-type biogenesis protein CcmH [Histophilus somni]